MIERKPLDDSAVDLTEITITTQEVGQMYPSNRTADACVLELQGPPQSYFELPLDWFTDFQGQIQPAEFPGAIRMVQRVDYKSFCLVGDTAEDVQGRAIIVRGAVMTELKLRSELGYIWWRLYPKYELDTPAPLEPGQTAKPLKPARHRVRLRLGTMPALSTRFWLDLSKQVENVSSEPLVPRG